MIKSFIKKFRKNSQLNNEKGQGMLEYILLVVVIVGLVIAAKSFLGPKMDDIQGQLGEKIGEVLGN